MKRLQDKPCVGTRISLLMLCLAAVIGTACRVEDGIKEGLNGGVSAAISAVIQAPVNHALDETFKAE